MLKTEVKKRRLSTYSSIRDNLDYWMGKTPKERVAAVEYLRKQYNGNSGRLQRFARIIQRT
jgi:hypothetical protein